MFPIRLNTMLPSKTLQAPIAVDCMLRRVARLQNVARCVHMQGHSRGFQAVLRALVKQRQRCSGHPEVEAHLSSVLLARAALSQRAAFRLFLQHTLWLGKLCIPM